MSRWTTNQFPPGLRHKPTVVGKFEDGSDEWLAARDKGVGASDTPSILGVTGAFSSCLGIWAQKTGNAQPREIDDKLADMFHFGHKMEPLIADELREREGYEVRLEPRTLAHPSTPFIQANLDGWVQIEGIWGPLELKNTSAWAADQWTEQVPLKYQVQIQHQMYVAGAEISVAAALVGGCEFLWDIVERNDEFIGTMVEKLKTFWAMVENNEMPKAGDLDLEVLKGMVQQDPDETIVLPFEVLHWAAQLDLFKEDIKAATKLKREAEASIWQALGTATIGITPCESVKYKVTTNKHGTKTLRRMK